MQNDRSKSLMQLRDSAKAAYGGKLAVAKNDVSTDGMVKHVPIDEDVVKTSVLGKVRRGPRAARRAGIFSQHLPRKKCRACTLPCKIPVCRRVYAR